MKKLSTTDSSMKYSSAFNNMHEVAVYLSLQNPTSSQHFTSEHKWIPFWLVNMGSNKISWQTADRDPSNITCFASERIVVANQCHIIRKERPTGRSPALSAGNIVIKIMEWNQILCITNFVRNRRPCTYIWTTADEGHFNR